MLDGLATRFHRSGGILHLTAHAGEIALHLLDATLGGLELALEILHHLHVEFFGHFHGSDGGAQSVLAVLRAFAGFLSGHPALFVLKAQRIALAGQLGDLRLRLRQAFARQGEFRAQRADIAAAAGGGELTQLGDHADEHVLGDVGEGRGVSGLEFLA